MKFRDMYYFLSNMYPVKVPMNIGGQDYIFDNAEAAFQAQKNPEWASRFVGLDGFDAKRLGRRVPIDRDAWNTARLDAMYNAVSSKFNNNPDLMQQLQGISGDIAEDNTWGDTFWGVYNGQGENNLGKMLMDIRKIASVAAPVAQTVAAVTPNKADDVIANTATTFKIADVINHPTFGEGIITGINNGIVDIDFTNAGSKKLGLEWLAKNIIK